MSLAIKMYNSVEEIAQTLDDEIADIKSALGDYLRRLDNVRNLAEKSRAVREIVMKLAGKKNGHNEEFGEIEVGDLKIVVDANAIHELKAIEDAVRKSSGILACTAESP